MNPRLRAPRIPGALQDPLSFAIVFGIVAGMMVYVSVKELLPSAFRFDPKDSIVSTSELESVFGAACGAWCLCSLPVQR